MDKHVRSNLMPDQNLLYTKVLDRLFLYLETGRMTFTDFMDPMHAEVSIRHVMALKHEYSFQVEVFGGREACERRMIGFAKALTQDDFPIAALEIKYNAKFAGLTHRDFLGALCGMGIDRGKLGDISVEKGRAIAFVQEDICEYLCANLDKAGNVKVSASRAGLASLQVGQAEKKELRVIVQSLRLDSLLSAVFHLSRAKSIAAIAGEKALVNWVVATEPSKRVTDGDIITLRGAGRVQLHHVEGTTKKGRLVVHVLLNR